MRRSKPGKYEFPVFILLLISIFVPLFISVFILLFISLFILIFISVFILLFNSSYEIAYRKLHGAPEVAVGLTVSPNEDLGIYISRNALFNLFVLPGFTSFVMDSSSSFS